jgi:carboxylesterase type B
MKLLLRIHIVVSLWLSSVSGEWRIGQSVQTTSGIVHGQGAGLKGNEEVSEYLGIPFAAPPVGHLRWKPPQRFTKSDSPIIASSWGPSCPSSQTSGSHMDESCLTINVWTKPQNGSTKKAVLFSIYGGGFNTGSSNTPYLNGAPLANRQDVVVVSLNYRLNIFGFPGIPGIEDNNLGMMDIRAGVEWVRDNIAVFGGDPKRITMFGESAGGGACDYYAFAWRDDPIVNGFIIQSGSVHTRGIAADNNRKPWHVVSSALGCAGEEINVNALDCMRGKDWKSIMSHVDTGPRNPGKTFGPTFDEKVIFKDYEARGKKGLFAQVVSIRHFLEEGHVC